MRGRKPEACPKCYRGSSLFPTSCAIPRNPSAPLALEMTEICRLFVAPMTRYRIHYPGWDSNWDEWVSRDRLRWPVDPSYLSTIFTVRDIVEVWCTGTHVKGAWLQARVRQVSTDVAMTRWQVIWASLSSFIFLYGFFYVSRQNSLGKRIGYCLANASHSYTTVTTFL